MAGKYVIRCPRGGGEGRKCSVARVIAASAKRIARGIAEDGAPHRSGNGPTFIIVNAEDSQERGAMTGLKIYKVTVFGVTDSERISDQAGLARLVDFFLRWGFGVPWIDADGHALRGSRAGAARRGLDEVKRDFHTPEKTAVNAAIVCEQDCLLDAGNGMGV